MKKILMTLMLAIVSSLWMMSEGASCLTQAPNNLQSSYITVSGTIQWLDNPCEEGEVCPACITPAIVTSDKTYYLSSSNQEVQDFLDRIEMAPVPAIYLLPLQASATGIPYTQGSFDFLVVNNLNSLYVQYFSDQRGSINSLCDEWNVLEFRSHMGYAPDEYNMRRYHLTTDTIIAGQRYIRLYRDNSYMGAMREGNNRDIYYIPAGTTHEYLLYAFNAQIGDELTDLWLGRTTNEVFTKEYFPYGVIATVEEITEITPRRFVLSVGYITTEEGVENYPYYFEWIEGIGFASAPDGADYPLIYAGGFTSFLLCAYKNGEQVYVSEWGAEYGCEYNDEEQSGDTIPIYSYTGDDPGSSTVDPVDPNQVVVTLKGDELTIKESSGDEINFMLTNTSVASSAAKAPKSDDEQSFRNEVSVQLTEDGNYRLILTNPKWDYKIYGTFRYAHQGLGRVNDESSATKILRDGQVLIERNGRVYSLTGIEIK